MGVGIGGTWNEGGDVFPDCQRDEIERLRKENDLLQRENEQLKRVAVDDVRVMTIINELNKLRMKGR